MVCGHDCKVHDHETRLPPVEQEVLKVDRHPFVCDHAKDDGHEEIEEY